MVYVYSHYAQCGVDVIMPDLRDILSFYSLERYFALNSKNWESGQTAINPFIVVGICKIPTKISNTPQLGFV